MYRSTPNNRERAATITAVVLIHLALGYAFLNVSNARRAVEQQEELTIFDVPVPPPPPIVEPLPEPDKAKPKKDEGAASAKNIESKATPVVAPKPRIVVPAKTPIVATPTPNTGAAPTQGASNVVGPGTGAGGSGTGTGSGGSGSGSGGGGTGGQASGATIIQSTSLTLADYPREVRRSWPRGGRVYVAVRVQLDGRGTDCKVNRSIGIPALDQWTCRLVEQKVRFRPAVDDRGKPYVAWYGYVQYWTGE
ncbi:MAG: energy transducer TonB [Sphingomonas bacterium]|nr:energy transducer TonB [Sphingomonas bacterium]